MPLPFSITRHVDMPATPDLAPIVDLLAQGLAELGAQNIAVIGRRIHFTAGLFRPVKHTNMLMTVTSGELTVAPFEGGVRITYQLRFVQFLAITGLAILVMAIFSLNSEHPRNPGVAAAVGLLAWVLIFGWKVGQALFAMPRWIRRTAAGGVRRVQ
jgi:hypothetical protein